MGAQTFVTSGRGKTAADAFDAAVRDARYAYGHGGYTGTIAEKNAFRVITPPAGVDPEAYAHALLNGEETTRALDIDDKWGPAACIDLGNGEFLFFGWASS